jgi:hypothetical protein
MKNPNQDLLDEGQDRLDECHAELEESRNQTMAEQKRTQACDEVAAGLRLKLSDARSERDKERKEATDNQVSNQVIVQPPSCNLLLGPMDQLFLGYG